KTNFACPSVNDPSDPHTLCPTARRIRERLGPSIISGSHSQGERLSPFYRLSGGGAPGRWNIFKIHVAKTGCHQHRIAWRILGNDSLIDLPFGLKPSFCLTRVATRV